MAPPTSSTLRVGLIGAGRGAAIHLPAYQHFPAQVHLSAICDIRAGAATTLAARAGVAAVYTDALRMIREAAIDAVDICTPNAEHASIAIAAAVAGKHVLVEKPMATTWADCLAMVEAADKAGVTLMVAQNQRFKPSYRAIGRAIQAGEIGDLRALRMDCMVNVLGGAGPDHWVYDGARAGGGAVMSLATHRLDLARYLAGEMKRATAVCRTIHPRFINNAEDHAAAILEFENGAMGELFASFVPFAVQSTESLTILGERGTIVSSPPTAKHNDPALICSARHGTGADGKPAFVPLQPAQAGLPTDEMFTNMILHFAECCRTGRQTLSSGRDNLGTMRVVFAIYESARRGCGVDLTPR